MESAFQRRDEAFSGIRGPLSGRHKSRFTTTLGEFIMKLNAMSVLALCVGIIVMGSPCFGQANACSPIGTWIGGSDPATPYHMTITPIGGDRYAIRAQQALDYPLIGYAGVTDWTGELSKVGGKQYEANLIAYFVYPLLVPQDDEHPQGIVELDAVHSTIEFNGSCDKIKNTITTYVGYYPWTEEMVPFVTDPTDFYVVNGDPLFVETYQRVPTACPICSTVTPKHSAGETYNLKVPFKQR
jgi:hypothetical protein